MEAKTVMLETEGNEWFFRNRENVAKKIYQNG